VGSPMLRRLAEDIRGDARKYLSDPRYPWYVVVLTHQSLWIILQYRISRWVRHHVTVPVLRQVLRLLCAIWRKTIELMTCCEFPNTAEIGRGMFIAHPYCIVIHCDAKIGDDCNLGHGVTIGIGGRGAARGVPRLGDRVFVGPGAKIFGPITIGNDVAIGANAVVTRDLPDGAVAVGVPARIISYAGSGGLIT
jgi:serine O-acetyltransferase